MTEEMINLGENNMHANQLVLQKRSLVKLYQNDKLRRGQSCPMCCRGPRIIR